MPFTLNKTSAVRLAGVHPDLQKVVYAAIAISTFQFIVTEGLRTVEREKEMVAEGKSQTMNSRHIGGFAVDLAAVIDGQAAWDWHYYEDLATFMRQAADQVGVPIEWGGDWKTLKDGAHFQLPAAQYPNA